MSVTSNTSNDGMDSNNLFARLQAGVETIINIVYCNFMQDRLFNIEEFTEMFSELIPSNTFPVESMLVVSRNICPSREKWK